MEKVRYDSKVLHPEVLPVSRESVVETLKAPRQTAPFYNKYEFTALVGTRAQQLADGAKPLISIEKMNTSDPQFVRKVAEREIFEKKLPFVIHRRLPDGTSEYWSAMELSVIW